MSTYYPTLTCALDDIANRSFYEGATITPEGVGYRVANDADPRHGDYLGDYGDGVEWPSDAIDHSREHDPAEHYATAAHVEHNLHYAVNELRDGNPVSFHYYAVSTACEITAPDYAEYHEVGMCDECEGYGDTITGWALVAYAA